MGRFVFEEINGVLVGKTDDEVLEGGLCYGFSTRYGGVSEGSLASLNLGVNRPDKPENLKQNYNIFCSAIGVDPHDVIIPKQIHSDIIMPVKSGETSFLLFGDEPAPQCDGLVTCEAERALGIFYADCTPVLLFDGRRKVLCTVHCGWRGTVKGFAKKAVQTMAEDYGCNPGDIHAAVGPCIGADCFEVGEEVAAEFEGFPEYVKAGKTPDKFYVDLKGVNREYLLLAGVSPENISVSDECTHCLTEKYFSHRGIGADTGRMAVIAQIKR